MNSPVFVDIETSGLPLEQLTDFRPEFKAASNLRDPEKIKANILEKEQAWKDELALSAVTGQVLVIGVYENGFNYIATDEGTMIGQILGWMAGKIQSGILVVGFCSRTFDIPFLIRRGFRHGLKVPMCFWEGRYLSSQFVDVAERWACGGREPRDRISLDTLSKFLGTGQKNGEGADFARLWAEDKPKALEYLKNDLLLTKAAYERLFG